MAHWRHARRVAGIAGCGVILVRMRQIADDVPMRALSVRQPYAELILRGIKTIEYRSRATSIIGERFYLYATKTWASGPVTPAVLGTVPARKAWSLDLAAPTSHADISALPWMVELATALRMFPKDLPTGVIVGSAVIERVSLRDDGMYQWHLAGVERAKTLRKPKGHPQPVWFRPF